MSNKKKRNPRRRFGRRDRSQCCLLCELDKQAQVQDETSTVSDRADELVDRMRAMNAWDACFAGFVASPFDHVDAFMNSWVEPREPLTPANEVALLALYRFWSSQHDEGVAA